MISDEQILINTLWDISRKESIKGKSDEEFEKYWKREALQFVDRYTKNQIKKSKNDTLYIHKKYVKV